MASTPLLCTICPGRPDFSDLSHLLTHIGSKGHLSHVRFAELRECSDEDVRQRLGTYKRWEEQYQIKRLLSKRLSDKDAKRSFKQERESSGKLTRRARVRLKRSPSPKNQQSPVKIEPAIDPQLTHTQAPPQHNLGLPFSPIRPKSTNIAQMYVPYMSEWQTGAQGIPHQTTYTRGNTGSDDFRHPSSGTAPDNDVNNEDFKTFIRSLTNAAYPDPTDFKVALPMSQTPQLDEQPGRLRDFQPRALFQDDYIEKNLDIVDQVASPVLKGVRWPGMSLFDSASLDAQRLRNQKKDQSILEQMAHNSMSVEQVEDIYWPDGSLKKRRLITGNVESSPASQPSPVLKRSRRPRTVKSRSALADLSTNGPTLPKKRGRKPKITSTNMHATKNDVLSRVKASITEHVPLDYDVADGLEVSTEGNPLADSPSIRPPRRAFTIFRDDDNHNTVAAYHGLPQMHKRVVLEPQSRTADAKSPRTFSADEPPVAATWFNGLQSHTMPLVRSSDFDKTSSNIKPQVPYNEGHLSSPERVIQRYFSVTGHEEPQFFDSMPPQMEFGGMTGPKYRGVTLNPLNPFFRKPHPRSPNTWASSAHGPSIGHGREP